MNRIATQIRRLQSILRRRGQGREDAEDLVQEAFLRLQVYCNEGNEVRSQDAFLTRTVLNLAANARESEHRHVFSQQCVEELGLIDISPTPDEVFAAEECLDRIQAILGGLSRRTREVFFMHR